MNDPTNAKTQLIESTQELLWERGYTGTSPKAIQQAAGVGQGSMYHHFDGKADLASAALQLSADQLMDRSAHELISSEPPLVRLRSYLMLDRDVLRGCRIGRMAQDSGVIEDESLREPVAKTLAWLITQLDNLLTEAQDAGQLHASLNTTNTAATIAATLQGGYVLARAQDSPEPFEQAIQGALGLIELASTTERLR